MRQAGLRVWLEVETEFLGRIVEIRAERDVGNGRPMLAEAAREGNVLIEDYLRYHFRRMTRDDWLMRTASGAMYQRAWPALR